MTNKQVEVHKFIDALHAFIRDYFRTNRLARKYENDCIAAGAGIMQAYVMVAAYIETSGLKKK